LCYRNPDNLWHGDLLNDGYWHGELLMVATGMVGEKKKKKKKTLALISTGVYQLSIFKEHFSTIIR